MDVDFKKKAAAAEPFPLKRPAGFWTGLCV